ncbi:MAG TPA: hypothetical protein VFQ71_13490 [Gaiellales bacterium]|jgi:hypothetical protein|nr:hypothetical protein [Gaiellales bacterium]
MLFWVFGSSAAGKTTLVAALRGRVPRLQVHDFDEAGVPPLATIEWRHRENERWIDRARASEAEGADLLVAGQTPIGELLAAPAAPSLEAIAACLLDCDDDTRAARIRARGAQWFDRAGGTMDDYLAWGRWLRRHAHDPTYRLDVIRRGDDQRWERLERWRPHDPRWRVRVIDTRQPEITVRAAAERWIADERSRRAAGLLDDWF